jgi:hypothetical protein
MDKVYLNRLQCNTAAILLHSPERKRMTDLRQAAQQALEALEDERYVTKYTHIVEAITALRKVLAQPEQQAAHGIKEHEMTDTEIDKALALAIGHKVAYVTVLGEGIPQVWVQVDPRFEWAIRVFDHRDWNVIGPIAERYDAFPYQSVNGNWVSAALDYHDTPQKAIALAVIGAKK